MARLRVSAISSRRWSRGRIVAPEASKLAMTHAWQNTTLAEDFGVADAHKDELYAATDWLIERQDKIEKRLAKRHLKEGRLVLFDLTSSSFEGVTCHWRRSAIAATASQERKMETWASEVRTNLEK
jgi:hypothetical protein